MVPSGAVGDVVKKPKVVVVGGGWSGLAAATSLTVAGWSVTLLDRARLLGGRSTSFYDEEFGEWLDHGSHVFIGAYRAALSLLEKWGSAGLIDFEAGETVQWLLPGGKRYHLRLGDSRVTAGLGLLAFGRLSIVGKAAATRGLKALVEYREDGLDGGATVAEILHAAGADRGHAREFFDALALAVMNCPTEIAAAAPFANAIREGLLIGKEAARIGVPTMPLSEVISRPAARYLKQAGVDVRLGVELKSLRFQESGGFFVEVGRETIESEVVILAIPPFDLKRILSDELARGIIPTSLSELSYAPISTVHLTFDRPVLDVRFGYLAEGFGHWVFGRGEQEGGGWRRVSVVISYSPSRGESNQQRVTEKVLEDLRYHLPMADRAQVVNVRVVRVARATVVLSPPVLKLRLPEETAIRGLYLAGDWCATGLPATIEGASRSGQKAAELAIRDWGRGN